MKKLELSQFAASYQVNYLRRFNSAKSQAFLETLLSNIANECVSRGAKAIGHIKLFGKTHGGGYFQGSVTSARKPPTVTAFNVPIHKELDFDLVVLVYSLADGDAGRIVELVMDKLTDEMGEIADYQLVTPSISRKEEMQ